MRKPVAALTISVGQRELLESVARSQSGAHREVIRAKALLMAADGVAACQHLAHHAGVGDGHAADLEEGRLGAVAVEGVEARSGCFQLLQHGGE